MTWSVSEGNHPLSCHDIPDIKPGHVHFHHNWEGNYINVWMLHSDYCWYEYTKDYAQQVSIPIRHPTFEDLYLTTYGNKSWSPNFVKLETLKKRAYPLPISRLFRPDSVRT